MECPGLLTRPLAEMYANIERDLVCPIKEENVRYGTFYHGNRSENYGTA